ncbi:MAG: chorismate mutase [Romboutsia sp.]
MKVLAIRGATTVSSNTKEDILNETTILIKSMIKANNLIIDDIISMCFTMTNDLDAVYASVAVREGLNICDIPLLNFEEKYIKDSLKKCVRVMVYINTKKTRKDMKHIYLNEAKKLRVDITGI